MKVIKVINEWKRYAKKPSLYDEDHFGPLEKFRTFIAELDDREREHCTVGDHYVNGLVVVIEGRVAYGVTRPRWICPRIVICEECLRKIFRELKGVVAHEVV